MKATGSFASAFVVHSEGMRKTAEGEYGLHDVFVIPLGSVQVSAVAGGRAASHHVVFFGFIRPEKGLQSLIGAIGTLRGQVPDIRLTIAGSVVHERERGYLLGLHERVQAEALTDHVRFLTKFLSDEEISELMREAAALALPYTDQFVEVSAIVHDVAGYGVPLVCSKTPRFSELVDGVDCLKVAPVSGEIARAILRILSEPDLATKLGEGLLLDPVFWVERGGRLTRHLGLPRSDRNLRERPTQAVSLCRVLDSCDAVARWATRFASRTRSL